MIPLEPYPLPGFLITATGTDVGKTTITALLAAAIHSLNVKLGLLKPIASGCPKHPDRGNDPNATLADDDLMPLDSILPAQSCGMNIANEELLRMLSPVRFAAPISPHVAAQLEDRPIDYGKIRAALDYWRGHSQMLLVEGAGGWLTPIDQTATETYMIADLASSLRLPVIVVTTPVIGSLNTTLLTVESIRARGLKVAGLVINKVPPEGKRDLNVISNLTELPRLTGVERVAVVPEWDGKIVHPVPPALVSPLMDFARGLAGCWGKFQ